VAGERDSLQKAPEEGGGGCKEEELQPLWSEVFCGVALNNVLEPYLRIKIYARHASIVNAIFWGYYMDGFMCRLCVNLTYRQTKLYL
jgi:hypothetical protein